METIEVKIRLVVNPLKDNLTPEHIVQELDYEFKGNEDFEILDTEIVDYETVKPK